VPEKQRFPRALFLSSVKTGIFSNKNNDIPVYFQQAESRGNEPEKRRFPRLSDRCSVMTWCFPVKSNSYLNYADLHE
jgi:hypothetical protein